MLRYGLVGLGYRRVVRATCLIVGVEVLYVVVLFQLDGYSVRGYAR
jgi:hypothetical protein